MKQPLRQNVTMPPRRDATDTRDDVMTGIGLKLLSTLSFAGMVVCVKFASADVASPLIVFARGAVMIAVLVPWMRWRGVPFRGSQSALLHLRGLLGAGALHCFYLALQRAPLAETVVLANTAPLYVPILGMIILGERLTAGLILIQLWGFAGVFVICGPEIRQFDTGTIAAAACGVIVAFGLIVLRKLAQREHALTIVFYFAMWTFLSPLALPWTWTASWEPIGDAWWLLVLVGLFAIGGQGLLTRALFFAPAGIIVLFNYFGTLLNFALGWLIWREQATSRTVIGAAMIVTACILTTFFRARLVKTSRS